MKKENNYTGGKSHNINFVAEVKSFTAPHIQESFIDDNGNLQHILDNGNTLSDEHFLRMWGQPKGKINLKTKGPGCDSRTNWIK